MQHTSYANGQAAHQYAKWISCGSLSYLHTYLRLSPAKIRQSSAVRSVTVEQYRNRYHLLIVREIYLFLAFVQSEFHYFLLARRVHRRECTGCISMCVLFARSYGSRTSGRRLEQVTSVTPVVYWLSYSTWVLPSEYYSLVNDLGLTWTAFQPLKFGETSDSLSDCFNAKSGLFPLPVRAALHVVGDDVASGSSFRSKLSLCSRHTMLTLCLTGSIFFASGN